MPGRLVSFLALVSVIAITVGCSCSFGPLGQARPSLFAPPIGTPTPALTTQPLEPSATASQPPQPSATATQAPATTPTPSPTAPSATLPASAMLDSVCIFVHHQRLNQFVSWFDFAMWWSGIDFFALELTIKDANNDDPVQLVFDPEDGSWRGQFGLSEGGTKQIVSLIAHLPDGSQIDLTDDLIDHLGSDEFTVRHPQEDVIGC